MLLMYLASAGGRVRTGLRRISAHSARLALQQFPIEQAPAELEEVIQGTRFDPCTLVIGTNHMFDRPRLCEICTTALPLKQGTV